jgi:ABC-type transport system involved in cytochrome c biogenesis ATPase subunit
MILGLVRPSGGAATIAGRPLAAHAHPARVVGTVLDGGPFNLGRPARSALRISALVAGVPEERVDELLVRVGLGGDATRRIRDYSLGMRQRLALAQALLADPAVVIADEPANGLDPAGINWLRGILRELADDGTTVLLSSHLLAEAQRLVVLGVSVLISPAIAAAVLATVDHLHDGPSQVAASAFNLSGVSTGILCASAFAAEYQDRSITTTFTLVPARGRVVLAKAVAAVIVGTLIAALTSLACYVLAAVWLHAAGVAWPWTFGNLARAAIGNVSVGAALALCGIGIGGITQSPPVAGTMMGLTWFGLSNLLATFLPFFRHYGLVAAQATLTEPTVHHQYSFGGALAATAAVATVLLLAGIRRVRLADIR